MKRIMLLWLYTMLSFCMLAQMKNYFPGGFDEADPDAWFDKEPYFACQNLYTNYWGYGCSITNVKAIVNGTDVYLLSDKWDYGEYIIIDKDCGVKFSLGDNVALYWGNIYIGTYRYSSKQADSHSVVPRLRPRSLKQKGNAKLLKNIWKYVKKIKL